jgi:hypothetical protein
MGINIHEGVGMANLQVKGVEEEFYEDLKRLAARENRPVSQQVIVMLREYMAKHDAIRRIATPADALLELAGSWQDDRTAEEIAAELRTARKRRSHGRDF